MNTPTPTPRTDAAWSASFEGKQLSAGQTARALRECSQQLERELTALTAERDQLKQHACADFEMFHEMRLKLTAAGGDPYRLHDEALDCLISERDQLRAEVKRLKTCGIVEIAASNPSVLDYCKHWEGRAERAEAAQTVALANWNGALERAMKAEDELAAERARLDSGTILVTVAGERVWHCGVDLRAAIDAGMKEDAK